MSRTFDLAYIVLMTALLIFMLGDVYISFEESAWRSRCKDAGGVSVRGVFKYECINPGVIIEVD